MLLQELLSLMGDEVTDADEESFLLFSQELPSQDLGFVDAKATTLELTVAGKDLTIHQSPTLLSSNRGGGTTGAVVWRVTPLFAEWISSPANVLFRQEVLTQGSVVLELGCGISGIVALTLAPRIGSYVATDQGYVLKLLNENLAENTTISTQPSVKPARQSSGHAGRRKSQASQLARTNRAIETMKLDWELDSLSALPDLLSVSSIHMSGMIDAVIACDCIYNEALIDPFVRTCAELCRLSEATLSGKPTVCIVAQQLRSPVVFESWLSAFHKAFRVWRVPEELLTEGLKENTGFALHMGLLREIIT